MLATRGRSRPPLVWKESIWNLVEGTELGILLTSSTPPLDLHPTEAHAFSQKDQDLPPVWGWNLPWPAGPR